MIQEDNNTNGSIHKGAVKTVITVLKSIKVSFHMWSAGLRKSAFNSKFLNLFSLKIYVYFSYKNSKLT